VAKELKPTWSGYLLIDGKAIYVKKERYALLLTADAETHDIPCAHFARSEDYESYKTLLKTVKEELRYPIKGIVIDGDPGLAKAVRVLVALQSKPNPAEPNLATLVLF